MSVESSVRDIRSRLQTGVLGPADAVAPLEATAHTAPIRAIRIEAYRLLGDIAGRAFEASREIAGRAAWVLLDVARHTDTPFERAALILAMGRAFRNVWVMPFVHSRFSDDDPTIVTAAIHAAGGLGISGLEEAVAGFLSPETPRPFRLAAIAALGRMGGASATDRLLPFLDGEPDEAATALAALTEIRSPAGTDAAIALLEREPERSVLTSAMRYLSEMGRQEVLPTLRRLAREEDAELRIAAGFAARALKAERTQDVGERLLVALTERDPAVRAALARRLRTRPAADVLVQAEVLLAEDSEGVVQILGELREPDVARFLLKVSDDDSLPLSVRALAIASIEASEPWKRDALARVITASKHEEIRAAAAHAIGTFAPFEELIERVGPLATDPAPALRGAFLWALQLAARPAALTPDQRARCETELRRALRDPEHWVRRRAAYVAGNLQLLNLAHHLVELAKNERERADLRVAAFIGLGELAAPAMFSEIVALFRREQDPQALAAGSRVLARTALSHPDLRLSFQELHGKISQLLQSKDPTVREAGVRLAGLEGAGVTAATVVPLAKDEAPRVREVSLNALGRLAAPESEAPLLAAFDDADPGVHERAAEALLIRGGTKALESVLAFVVGEGNGAARAGLANRMAIPEPDAAHFLKVLDRSLARLPDDDDAYEPLLSLKVRLLERRQVDKPGAADVDASIMALFPGYPRLVEARGSEPLARSLRTAEALYGNATGLQDADLSSSIVLWMKCMEGYVHGWLAGRLQALQRDPRSLFDHVDRLLANSWPIYQQFVSARWKDAVDVGQAHVEVPLRSVANALREFQERRPKRLDSPLSVTEWARMMVFFAVDHPAGVRNLFHVGRSSPDQVVRLAHRMHTLAAVRNVVTHRATAGALTLEAFRKAYYSAFEELTRLA